MTYEELHNENLRLYNQIKEWVLLVEELKKENAQLKSKLQKMQNVFENGISVNVTFRGKLGYLPNIDIITNKWSTFGDKLKDGTFEGRVVILE